MSSIAVKVLIVGNSGVGKTSLCNRYINDDFRKAYKPTVGVEFCSKEIISERRNKYNFYFWDIGGQERYIHMTHCFYKDADFCLVIFDITNRESFLACAKWKKDLDDKYMLKSGKSCPCLLIGNKCDLPNRVLDQLEIADFCKENNFFGYMEISAKNDIMVKETVAYVTSKIIGMKEDDMEKGSGLIKDISKIKKKIVYLTEDTSKVNCTSNCCGF